MDVKVKLAFHIKHVILHEFSSDLSCDIVQKMVFQQLSLEDVVYQVFIAICILIAY